MRRLCRVETGAFLLILLGTCGALRADDKQPTLAEHGAVGYQQAERHDPYSPNYADFLPAGRRRFGGYSPGYGYGYGGSGFNYGYYGPYDFGYGWGYPGPIYGWGFFGYPSVYSGQDLFGPNLERLWNPLAVQPQRPQVNINVFDAPPDGAAGEGAGGEALEVPRDPQPANPKPKIRAANAEALTRAWHFIEIGDRYFQKQEYRQAYQRYKEAAQAAPNLVEAYLREGQAMLATGQYAIAAVSFKRGLKLAPDWSRVRFQIGEMYGDRRAAHTSHLESLATAAEQNPGDGDLLLLVGLELQFDGQPDRARPFFTRAAAILAADDAALAAVVEQLAAEAVAAETDEAQQF